MAPVSAPLIAIAVFAGLMRVLGGYFYLDFALADWAFAADLARDEVAGLDAILERFTEEVTAALRDHDADEVLLSSVSLGAVMMAETIDRVCGREPEVGLWFRRTAFLTVGFVRPGDRAPPGGGAAAQADRPGRRGEEPLLGRIPGQGRSDQFLQDQSVKDLGNPRTGCRIVRQIRIREHDERSPSTAAHSGARSSFIASS